MLALSDTALLIGTLHEGLIVVRNHGIEYLDMAKGLAGTSVYSLYRDHAGIIWIGTDKGAQPYDPATAMLHACPDTLSEKPVYAICENGENPVFASSNRLYQLVKGSWSSIQPGNLESPVTFFSAFYDSNGNGWFGSSGHGLFKKNGSNWYNYFNSTGLNEYSFVSLCEDSQQNLWFASYSDLYRFDGLNWTSMAKSFGLRNIYFRQILADGEGNIWCTSDYGGLYNFNGSEWTHYPVDVYFNGSNIRRMALGPDGSLWVTSWYSGLYRYDGKAWTRFTTEQGLASNNTAAVAWYADGRMAVASDFADLSIYDGHTWTSDYTLSGYHSIVDMAVDGKGNTWLATQNGIIKYNGAGTEEFFRDPNYSWNYIPFIQADKAGHIWTCNLSSGLFHFDGNAWKNYSMNDGLSTNYLTDILFDSKNRIWLTSNYGINMSSNITGVPEIETEGREVLSAFPNPFLQRVDIQYYSVTGGSARFQFYTAEGRLLLVKEKKVEAGNNVFHFDSSGWPEGILFCTMNMNGGIRQIKLMKLTDK
jgi:ligand-binding sensor domain-containing protein